MSPQPEQYCHTEAILPEREIVKGHAAGCQITSLTYGGGQWVLIMTKCVRGLIP